MAEWTSAGRIDTDGDPVFLAADGGLWSVRRGLGSVEQVLARLRSGEVPPWSQMERVGHESDWVVSIRHLGPAEAWPQALDAIAERLLVLSQRVRSHDWEEGHGFLFRARLDEAGATAIAEALAGRPELEVAALPILAHMSTGD